MSDGSPAVSAPASATHAATAAYARIYEEQQPRLVAYARSLTRNAWTAEDLVAEAHFRVWRRLAAGHEIDNVPAYLMTTVRHLAIAAGSAVRETPRDPHGEERVEVVEQRNGHGGDPAEQVSSVDLVVRVLGQLPERWVKALWLAEAEGQPLAAIGPQLGTKEGATAVLLHRAREGMRQAFLRAQTGAPDDPACQVHWARMPAYVRGAATAKQSERLLGHVDACDDCRARLAALMSANDRLPAIVGPALLVFVVGGAGKFLLAFTAGSAGAATAAGGHGGLLHGVRQAAVGGSKAQAAVAAGAVVAGAAVLLLVLGPADAGQVPARRTPVADAPVVQAPVAEAPVGPPSTAARNGGPKKDDTSGRGAGVQGSQQVRTNDTDRTATSVPEPRDTAEPTPAPGGDTAGGKTDDTPPPPRTTPKGTDPAPPKTGGSDDAPKAPPSPPEQSPEPPAPTEQPPTYPAPPTEAPPETPAPPTDDTPETPAPPTEETPETPAPPTEGTPETPAPPTEGTPETPAPPTDENPETPAPPTDENPETPAPPTEGTPETPAPPTHESPETPAPPTDETPETPGAPSDHTPEPESPSAPSSEPETPTPADPEPVEDPAPATGDTGTPPVTPPAQDPSPTPPGQTGCPGPHDR
ncbi:sigma-70 family RNA polymerase sigma factor [Streptomyces sp. NPDC001401]|uniref:sigma-70 family RNA polymerase sigma factor n=1 Tax=Streptomyces sp. NPDC001401 TaxID=3364570 RepID=UPI00367BF4BF